LAIGAARQRPSHAGRIARPRCPPVSGARAGGGADHCAEAAPAPEDAPRSGGDDR
jgi:hypothetical protein